MKASQLQFVRNCLRSSLKLINNVNTADGIRPLPRSGGFIPGKYFELFGSVYITFITLYFKPQITIFRVGNEFSLPLIEL
jgi:hypothetical protein